MSLKSIVGAVVAAGVLACAGQAGASQWVATYKGHMSDGYDYTGVFGTGGADLSGLDFVATFRYDTAIGSITSGAAFEQGLSTLLDATLSIGGSAAWDFGSGFSNQI